MLHHPLLLRNNPHKDLNLILKLIYLSEILLLNQTSLTILVPFSLLQVTTEWETLTQIPVTVRSPLAPASSVTPLSTWPRRRGDSATLEESGNPTLGGHGWSEEPPPTLTSTASGMNSHCGLF